MRKAIILAVGALLVMLATHHPANARRLPDGINAAQLRKGLAAFNRHDYTTAGQLLRTPAERGNPDAQAVLCFLYTYGRGVTQSYHTAAHWCRRAANQGNVQGQYMLGLLYNKGHGVPEDFIQAYKWLNLAAARAAGAKREFSYRIRDSVASKMSPAQIVEAQALATEYQPMPELQDSASVARRCASRKKCLDP